MTNVYLQYPWKFPDSPYYKYLLNYPPENVVFTNSGKDNHGVITSTKKFALSNKTKDFIRKTLNILNVPISNSHKTRSDLDFDLIHCAHCLSKNESPWVADIEAAWSLWVSGRETKVGKRLVKEKILSDNCKKLMPWTEWARDSISSVFENKKIDDRMEVVYPAVPLQKTKKKTTNRPTIMFVSRYFWIKGGLFALESLSRLKKKYDFDVIFISEVPNEIKKRYPEIEITGLVPQEELFNNYYPRADIFLYPSFVDTFGFSLLEAMSFKIPIVTVDNPTRREIVDKTNGFVSEVDGNIDFKNIGKREEKIVDDLTDKLSKLIEDKKLRNKLGRRGYKRVKDGKFSIKKRNKKLKRIYEEAAK